jgi:hypothetical protein
VLGVELVGEGELDSHQIELVRCLRYHQYQYLIITKLI